MSKLSSDTSERQVIGAVVVRPDSIDDADLEPDHFFHPGRRAIWRVLLEMRAAGALGSDDAMESAIMDTGDHLRQEWLTCAVAAGTADNIAWHADVVREHALTRAVLAAISEVTELHRKDEGRGTELLGMAQAMLHKLGEKTGDEVWTMAAMCKRRMRQLDEQVAAYQRGEPIRTGIPTGLASLDEQLGGYQTGIVTGLLGRPAMGKSSLLQAAVAAACSEGIGVHVFSLEDRWESFVDRAVSRLSRIPVTQIRRATIAQGDWTRFIQCVHKLSQWKSFRYSPTKSVTVEQLVAKVRRERAAIDTELVVIDYLGLLCKSPGHDRAQDSLNHACDYLSRVASQDELAIVLACQMNRDAERRPDKRPQLSDAREAGHFEQSSKTMLGLYRPAVYDEKEPSDRAEILVLKNNDGPIGRIKAHWDGPTTTISDRTDNADWR